MITRTILSLLFSRQFISSRTRPKHNKERKGGPMFRFSLGGHGAAWSLFNPRIHDEYLRKILGTELSDQLVDTWYKEGKALMVLCLTITNTIHQNLMERLNIEMWLGYKWQWGRIASETLSSAKPRTSTSLWVPLTMLELAMSKGRNVSSISTGKSRPSFTVSCGLTTTANDLLVSSFETPLETRPTSFLRKTLRRSCWGWERWLSCNIDAQWNDQVLEGS